MIRKVHQCWKVVVIGFLMLFLIAVGNAARLVARGPSLRSFQNQLVQRLSRVMLAVLGIEVIVEGDSNWPSGGASLVVSNHHSYLDILYFAAYKPLCFVSTVEVRNTPVLGQLAAAGGCVFVERRSRENIRQEIDLISGTLREGHSMIFFPEGTSTNGSSVLPFKRPLFAPAQQAEVPVVPAVVQPLEIDGRPVTSANRDFLCWYGDMDFAPHLFALAGLSRAKVMLKILPAIPVTAATKREELAQAAQQTVTNHYRPIV